MRLKFSRRQRTARLGGDSTAERVPAFWARVFLIGGLALAAYAPVIRAPFQLDDHITIEANPSLRSWRWSSLKQDWIPPQNEMSEYYYRPLQTLVNRVQYSFWGLNPIGYHLTNLFLHAGCAAMSAELLMALSFPWAGALVTGCLMAVHPMIVSELLMASGLPEIMSFFFTLMALLLGLRENRGAQALALGAAALALLSKESAVALPFLYVLASRRVGKSALRSKVLWGLVATTAVYTVLRTAAMPSWNLNQIPMRPCLSFMVSRFAPIVMRYIGLVFFPWPLHSYRLMPTDGSLLGWGGLIVLILIYTRYGRPAWASFAGLWVLLTLLPKIPLMATGHYMLEHWVYPALPVILLPGGLFAARGLLSGDRLAKRISIGCLAILMGGFIVSTRLYLLVRWSDEGNYRWSLRFTRATPLLFNLGLICLKTGRAAEAVQYIHPVFELYPNDLRIRRAWAAALAATGRIEEAKKLLHESSPY